MTRLVSEPEFRERLSAVLSPLRNAGYKSITGPGRSGAIAAAYASHFLGIPFITHGRPQARMLPCLVVDTATESGRTLKRALRKARGSKAIALFNEPPRVKFWYEAETWKTQATAIQLQARFAGD